MCVKSHLCFSKYMKMLNKTILFKVLTNTTKITISFKLPSFHISTLRSLSPIVSMQFSSNKTYSDYMSFFYKLSLISLSSIHQKCKRSSTMPLSGSPIGTRKRLVSLMKKQRAICWEVSPKSTSSSNI